MVQIVNFSLDLGNMLQGFYRNHMEEVIKFFETHHKVISNLKLRISSPLHSPLLLFSLLYIQKKFACLQHGYRQWFARGKAGKVHNIFKQGTHKLRPK